MLPYFFNHLAPSLYLVPPFQQTIFEFQVTADNNNNVFNLYNPSLNMKLNIPNKCQRSFTLLTTFCIVKGVTSRQNRNKTIVQQFILLNPSCNTYEYCILGNLKNLCAAKSRTRLAFRQKPVRADWLVSRSYTELQNAAGKTRYICYFGFFSMNDKLVADPTDSAKVLFLSIHSANKIGKVWAFLALHDELRHQQMTKITHKIAYFLCFYGLNSSRKLFKEWRSLSREHPSCHIVPACRFLTPEFYFSRNSILSYYTLSFNPGDPFPVVGLDIFVCLIFSWMQIVMKGDCVNFSMLKYICQ